MRVVESGLNAMVAMFLRFSNGRVNDLLLFRSVTELSPSSRHVLDEIKDRDAIPYWTEKGVSICGE